LGCRHGNLFGLELHHKRLAPELDRMADCRCPVCGSHDDLQSDYQ